MSPQIEIVLIASVVAVACVIPGVFLVLRGVSLMSDAISHAILLGIVLSFFWVKTLESPLLIIGASLAGIFTVTLTEAIIHTRRLKEDAAIGLVYPVLFALGIILINRYAGDVHIDSDAVLLGELAFAPFNRVYWEGVDLGPYSLWVMSIIFLINLTLLLCFYKELKLATFDKGMATALGFSPMLIHYGLMTVTSVTAVGAFDAVGSILVVALMITPPATAYLLTERLSIMILLSMGIGIVSGISGYVVAHILDASIAGSMAMMTGILFVLALLFSKRQGLLVQWLRSRQHRYLFSAQMLAVQLLDHEGKKNEATENTVSNMIHHMGWDTSFAHHVTRISVLNGYMTRHGNFLKLTPLGREIARSVMINS